MGLIEFLASIPTASNLKMELDKSRLEVVRVAAERDAALAELARLEVRVAELAADNAKLQAKVKDLKEKPKPEPCVPIPVVHHWNSPSGAW